MWQKYINREFMGTRLAGERERSCVMQTSTSLAEAGKWLLTFVALQKILRLRWGFLKGT